MLYSCLPAAARPRTLLAKRPRGGSRRLTVDIHCHVHTPAADDLVRPHLDPQREPMFVFANDETREVNRKQQERVRPQLTSVERRLKAMDKAGIDIQAISTAPPQYYYWAEPELGRDVARTINDNIARIVHEHPDRFVGLCTVPMQAPEFAVAELERAVKELGFRGVEINSNVAGEELSAERFRPFFAKAAELDVVVFMHPNGFTEGRRLADHYFINIIGNPLDSTVAVHHLIFGGVLEQYPRLKLVVAHGGGFLPAYAGRIDHAHKYRPDCRRCITKRPSTYLRKMYFDTITFTHHQLEYLVQQYGADHVLLGTDYPYDMALPNAVEFVETAALDRAEKAAILGGNAAKLLKLKLPAAKAGAKKAAGRRPAAKRAAAKGKAPAKRAGKKARAAR
jgi:aminocarboxymuconate-semialdehyde decarboxylase